MNLTCAVIVNKNEKLFVSIIVIYPDKLPQAR